MKNIPVKYQFRHQLVGIKVSMHSDDGAQNHSLGSDQNEMEARYLFKSVFGDRLRYQQVLLNFLSNSVKFTRRARPITVICNMIEVQHGQYQSIDASRGGSSGREANGLSTPVNQRNSQSSLGPFDDVQVYAKF